MGSQLLNVYAFKPILLNQDVTTTPIASKLNSTSYNQYSSLSLLNVNTSYDILNELNQTNPYKTFYDSHSTFYIVSVVLILGLIDITTLAGNLLVVIAVLTTKSLHTVTNSFIMSLAVADMLVAIFVLPLSIYMVLHNNWIFGNLICDLWIGCDVMLCTASILNLCCISLDRYFAITRPLKYSRQRSPRLARGMIAVVWIGSILISCPPVFGWKDENREEHTCTLNLLLSYRIYSSMGSFFLPCFIMVFVYSRIFKVIHDREKYLMSNTSNGNKFSILPNPKKTDKSLKKKLLERKKSKSVNKESVQNSKFLCCYKSDIVNEIEPKSSSSEKSRNDIQIKQSQTDLKSTKKIPEKTSSHDNIEVKQVNKNEINNLINSELDVDDDDDNDELFKNCTISANVEIPNSNQFSLNNPITKNFKENKKALNQEQNLIKYTKIDSRSKDLHANQNEFKENQKSSYNQLSSPTKRDLINKNMLNRANTLGANRRSSLNEEKTKINSLNLQEKSNTIDFKAYKKDKVAITNVNDKNDTSNRAHSSLVSTKKEKTSSLKKKDGNHVTSKQIIKFNPSDNVLILNNKSNNTNNNNNLINTSKKFINNLNFFKVKFRSRSSNDIYNESLIKLTSFYSFNNLKLKRNDSLETIDNKYSQFNRNIRKNPYLSVKRVKNARINKTKPNSLVGQKLALNNSNLNLDENQYLSLLGSKNSNKIEKNKATTEPSVVKKSITKIESSEMDASEKKPIKPKQKIKNNVSALSLSSHSSNTITSPKGKKPDSRKKNTSNQEQIRLLKESKAAKTLAIVVGGFILSWLPFFLMYVIEALLPRGYISKTLADGITWLGYFNSVMNPIIYAFYSKQFRSAFYRLTIGKFYNKNPQKELLCKIHYQKNSQNNNNYKTNEINRI